MTVELLQGNCIEVLKTLEACSVQTVVTSPPYYGLRDYGTAKWEGSDPACDHSPARKKGQASSTLSGGQGTNGHKHEGFKSVCGKCGAVRVDKQIGLEETPEAYVQRLVDVFREVRRVLKSDGTFWLVIGDSYWTDSAPKKKSTEAFSETWNPEDSAGNGGLRRTAAKHGDIKNKDLIGIPWMVAFALRADGWYLRQEIIWHKRNPMPEPVKDRCTKSHEQMFLLSKSSKYFFDYLAIQEPAEHPEGNGNQMPGKQYKGRPGDNANLGGSLYKIGPRDTRNKRDVWSITNKPYPEAHFATFPPDLIEPCILAGSRVGDTVLDCFNGSGTTGAVSVQYGRNYIGIDLNPAYIELSRKRLADVQIELALK